jgi:hypothetical protein
MLTCPAMLERIGRVLFVVNLVLALTFGAGFVVLVSAPAAVERHARDELVLRIASDAVSRYPVLATAPWIEVLATGLRGEAQRTQASRDHRIESTVALTAEWLRRLCLYDCGEVKVFDGQPAKNWFAERVLEPRVKGEQALPRVEHWARQRYEQLITEVLADVGVMAFSNALLFMLAALATRRATLSRHSLILSGILLVSALIGSALYVYGQNWLQTLLFADYVGVGYVIGVSLIGGALSDLAFNRGRFLAQILVHAPGAIASAS